MSAAGMVFKVLTMYQPGGPAERQSLLNYLVEPKVNDGEWQHGPGGGAGSG